MVKYIYHTKVIRQLHTKHLPGIPEISFKWATFLTALPIMLQTKAVIQLICMSSNLSLY